VIYFLQGTESFLFDRVLEDIVKQTKTEQVNIVYYSANETDIATLVLELSSDDIFGANKVIVLKDLAQQKVGTYLSGVQTERLTRLHTSTHTLVIHFWREEALTKTLTQELAPLLQQATIINTKKQKEKDVVAAMKKALAGRNTKLSPHELAAIAQKYQNNLALIHNEINRIVLSKDAVDVITIADFKTDTQFLEEQVFDLIDMLEKRQLDKVSYLLDNIFLHQQNVFGLLALLLKNYKEMYQMQVLDRAGYTVGQVTRELSLHPYRAKLLFAKARRFHGTQYQVILKQIIMTELALKQGKTQALALRELCLHIVHVQA
jgi:DNA polymerase-3 subunit delta